MRLVHVFALGSLCLALWSGAARGNGSIDETGATFTIGDAPAKGTLTKNACAPPAAAPAIPPLGTLGAIGTFSSALPAFPGGGAGGGGAFVGAATATLPGGNFEFTSFTVNAGVVLTYSGSVTIRTTGAVSVLGTVQTNSPNSSITFRCAGPFTVGAAARVRTLMGTSPLTIDAGEDFTAAAGADVTAVDSDIEITTHGLNAAAGNVTVSAAQVFTSSAAVRLRAKGAVSASGGVPIGSAPGGSLLVQAFGGDVTFSGGVTPQVGDAGAGVVIEASGAVTSTGVNLFAEDGGITLRAFGGNVSAGGIQAASEGDVTIAASGAVSVPSNTIVGGTFTATAHGGDVSVGRIGGSPNAEGIVLAASQDVSLSGQSYTSAGSDFTVRAIGGNVTISGVGTIEANVFDVRAAGSITVTSSFPNPGALKLSAGTGGIGIVNGIFNAFGPIDLIALGPVTIGANLTAYGNLTITSCDAGVDTGGMTLRTREAQVPGSGDKVSGDVTVQSFAGVAAAIDVAGSTISTEDADDRSGSIRILARESKIAGGGTVESYFLPTSVTAKANAKDPSKSKLTISGTFDTGPNDVGFTQAASLDVGTLNIAIPNGLTSVGSGKSFEHKSAGLVFRVTPSKTGSSRAKFTLTRTGDFTGIVNPEGSLRLHYAGQGADAEGVVVLHKGRYAFGKVRGALVKPNLYLASVSASSKGAGKDKLSLTAGLASGGVTPVAASDFKLGFGDGFTATIPAASFTRKGDRYTFKGNVQGITGVTLDYKKERVTVTGKGMTLGALPVTGAPILVTIGVGTDERAVRVRMARTGSSLKY